ncbi:hypothetical protein [Fluviicola chungangensis]|uniref:DUF4352 domain-containing protein n=1 Tax=Fluviicola chungangensis TaxID=2597671 RepID=A0A556N7V3_9FLAO|nr:hypothetical protein [Fluviicola chungangensis]TSJ48210.1 hypothetical protein FO442_03465 [Fluviicola chungangensis]
MSKKNVLGKLTLFFVGIMFCMSTAFSQEKLPVESIKSDWVLFKEAKGIKFYAKQEVIETNDGRKPVSYAVVKLENTTNKEVKLLYNLEVHYNLGCNNCNPNSEARQLVTIAPNKSIEGKYTDGNTPLSVLLLNANLNNGWIPEYLMIGNLIIN